MARYVFNAGFPIILGSRGGATFQRCGRVFAIRKRSIPTHKNTPKQTASRNAFEFQAGRFRTLTVGAKATWTTYAPDYQRTDSLGNLYTVKPQALQISTNMTRLYSSQGALNNLVAAIALPVISEDTFALAKGVAAFDLVTLPDVVPAEVKCIFYCGAPSPIRRSFTKADCRNIWFVNAGTASSSHNNFSRYTAFFPFNLLDVGAVIPVWVDIVQLTSGQVLGSFSGYADIIA